ncbi:MAG: energy transducer TonB [Flavobacteriales bacterium]|nr:energy transducer TonB [Flavobacteriales bacterium]
MGLASWRIAPVSQPEHAAPARVFPGIEQQPEFPGGTEALYKHLGANIRYPEQARTDKAEGTVYVVFTVKANGAIADASIKRGVHADIDAEALRVVKGMPNWKPATSDGKAVDAQMTLPIAFKLEAGK